MHFFVMCSLEKLTQELTSSRIKLYVTTLSYINMFLKQKTLILFEKLYKLRSAWGFDITCHVSQLGMTCFPAFFFHESC